MRLLMMMMGWSAMMGSTHPKTINEAIQDIVTSAPANCLADIYADKEDELDDSDAEDRGAGINLDPYIMGAFSTTDATRRWMEWNGE